MDIEKKGSILYIKGKELNALDRLVLEFVSLIDSDYVIVSGYVAILFGRSRNTEDIDLFIRDRGLEGFSKFYNKVSSTGRYWSLNSTDAADAYELMTVDKSSLRFAEKGTVEPNFEIKFASKETDYYSLKNALTVDFGEAGRIKIAPLELGIAYKLYLGSEKDFADAKHLFITLKEIIGMEKLKVILGELKIRKEEVRRVLGDL